MSEIKYKRVLLKLSGEAIGGEEGRGEEGAGFASQRICSFRQKQSAQPAQQY